MSSCSPTVRIVVLLRRCHWTESGGAVSPGSSPAGHHVSSQSKGEDIHDIHRATGEHRMHSLRTVNSC